MMIYISGFYIWNISVLYSDYLAILRIMPSPSLIRRFVRYKYGIRDKLL